MSLVSDTGLLESTIQVHVVLIFGENFRNRLRIIAFTMHGRIVSLTFGLFLQPES